MTKSTITREQLEEWVAQFDEDGGRDATDRQLEALIRQSLAAMDSEHNRNPVLAYADSYRDVEKQGVESVPIWSVITDLERNIAPLYRHAQQPVVDADDNFYSWFGREWHENYQHNQYTTAAKQMLGVMAESAWKAGRRAAMLQAGYAVRDLSTPVDPQVAEYEKNVMQAGNSPVIPDGYVMVPKEPTAQMYDAGDRQMTTKQVWDAMLASAPQEVQGD